MSGSIASLISDFSSPAATDGMGIGILRRVRQAPESETAPVQPVVDRQAELLKSLELRVRAEEQEAARTQLEQVLKSEQERHREELATQREIWIEQEARQLSMQIVTAIGNLEGALAEKAARILSSVIPEALRHSAISEFTEALRTILSGESGPLVRVTGPADILTAIEACIVPRDGVVEFIPTDAVEVILVAGDTIVQTQFSGWSDRLQSALKAMSPC
ncbi:hypothetical protein [Microvirga sp. TS319]|uniref:hypothetical protein n=1 Tax=Microvirga sp. TS319 TaxID=3241165 RepID=UPI00351A49CD